MLCTFQLSQICNFRCNELWSEHIHSRLQEKIDLQTEKPERCKEKEKIKIELNLCAVYTCLHQFQASAFLIHVSKLIEKCGLFDIENVAFQIWMKISLSLGEYWNGISAHMCMCLCLCVLGCIYHERVKSRSHSCDNHLDIHRRRDKNWKWLVKNKNTHNIFIAYFPFGVLCVRNVWIDQPKPHPQQDISCEAWCCVWIHNFWFPLEWTERKRYDTGTKKNVHIIWTNQ